MPWTYMLRCSDGSYYVGSTWNLDRRLDQHARGVGARYTRRRRPVVLVWSDENPSIAAAYANEKQIQNWGRAKREALIAGDYELLRQLASRRRTDPGGEDGPADPLLGLETLVPRSSTSGEPEPTTHPDDTT